LNGELKSVIEEISRFAEELQQQGGPWIEGEPLPDR
jgi:hypothetical protein